MSPLIFFFGIAAKKDYDLLNELVKIRVEKNDIGVCVSAYYYQYSNEVKTVISKIKKNLSIPIILDNGQIQSFRHGKSISEEKLLYMIKIIKPEFVFAPDIIGSPEQSLSSLIRFIKNHSDLRLLAPLQAHNNGLLFLNKLEEEINILYENGYRLFGIGTPHQIRCNTTETAKQIVPFVGKRVPFLHFMGYPIGRGLPNMNFCNSVDGGTFWIMKKYWTDIYNNPIKGAQLLSALMDVDISVRNFFPKQERVGDEN